MTRKTFQDARLRARSKFDIPKIKNNRQLESKQINWMRGALHSHSHCLFFFKCVLVSDPQMCCSLQATHRTATAPLASLRARGSLDRSGSGPHPRAEREVGIGYVLICFRNKSLQWEERFLRENTRE